jgi:hypothetical protein
MNSQISQIKRVCFEALIDQEIMEIVGEEKCNQAYLMACELETLINEESLNWNAKFHSFSEIISELYLALAQVGLEEALGEVSWRVDVFEKRYI